MNALTSTKTSAHRWVLISAGILLYANGVLAAPPVGDAQQQARDLILGTVNGQARTIDKLHAVAADGHSSASLDPQEQARQMILGTAHDGNAAGPTVASTPTVPAETNHRTHSDPQEQARQMILGRAASVNVSSERSAALTERRTTNVQ
jgi:hypothetical protein